MSMHSVPDELLADYAAGATSAGVSLLVAAHLTHIPSSRERVEVLESVGGAFLEDEEPAELSADALEATLAILDLPEPSEPKQVRTYSDGPVPGVVLDAVGTDFDNIPWKFRLPGVSTVELKGFDGEKVSLMRAHPGAKILQHTHEGPELTLVLQGCMRDGGIDYRRGDIAVNDEHDDHSPHIAGDEVCYCLVVQQGDLRFTGRFSRVLNYIGE